MIEAMWRIASMYQRIGRYEQAVRLLSLLLHHIDPAKPMPRPIKRQLDMLQSQVSAEVFHQAAHEAAQTSLNQLGRALLHELLDTSHQSAAPLPEGIEPLSERELEVLRLAADGLSNREIAERLVVTLGTVKKHLNNIFSKLDVKRRTQAIERAHQWRLFS
jgi:ATP/maltotriose-dependent transcriptional regulator MalT